MASPVLANKYRPAIFILALLVAIGLISYSVWGFWQQYRTTHEQHVAIPSQPIAHSTETPSETPPTEACKNYTVASGKPRKIEIPSIGVSTCIQQVGIDQNKAIAVPSNIYLAGWYTSSKLPGAPGISLIDGHVGGRYKKDAVFSKLAHVQTDDTIRIQFGDGSWKTFLVRKKTSYPAGEVMNHAFTPLGAVKNQLNLITCDGTYVDSTYTNRLLVQAALVP